MNPEQIFIFSLSLFKLKNYTLFCNFAIFLDDGPKVAVEEKNV